MNKDLDFLGIRYVNPGEYPTLSRDEQLCVAIAQSEIMAVAVRVYQVEPGFTGVIKGNIATVGRESVVQEIDSRFTPDKNIPHLMLHKKSNLSSDVKPGDEVVIRYADGSAKVIPVDKEAKYAYDIDFEGDPAFLKRIAEFLNAASDGGKVRLTSDRIAEVVGNAITNAHLSALKEFGVARPDKVSVAITEHVKTLDLSREAIRVSEKLLKAHERGYRIDMQESTKPQVVFIGAPKREEDRSRMKM